MNLHALIISLNLMMFGAEVCLRMFDGRCLCSDHGVHFRSRTFSEGNRYHRSRRFVFRNACLSCWNAFGVFRFGYSILCFRCWFLGRLGFACSFQEYRLHWCRHRHHLMHHSQDPIPGSFPNSSAAWSWAISFRATNCILAWSAPCDLRQKDSSPASDLLHHHEALDQ